MKKALIIIIGCSLILTACNKEAFLKKLNGCWRVDKYTYSGTDKTASFDSIYKNYKLCINTDNTFTESWDQYTYFPDSTIAMDTIGYDSLSMAYVILYDTTRFTNSINNPYLLGGDWELINSEEDLQLRDTANSARQMRILLLDRNNLDLRYGNKEYNLGKN